MNKKIVLVPIITVIIVLSLFVYMNYLQNPEVSSFPNAIIEPPIITATPVDVITEKIEVSNLRIDTSSDWLKCCLYFPSTIGIIVQ